MPQRTRSHYHPGSPQNPGRVLLNGLQTSKLSKISWDFSESPVSLHDLVRPGYYFSADAYDNVVPIIPHLTHATPFSAPIFTVAIVSLVVVLPILPILPLRPVFLVGGLLPFALTHPWSLRILPKAIPPLCAHTKEMIQQFTDDDRLSDEAWTSALKEVDLWENERWSNNASSSGSVVGWSKANLRPGERNGWTRRRDGWSDVSTTAGKGDSSMRSDRLLLPLEYC